jgi:aminopeptidase N
VCEAHVAAAFRDAAADVSFVRVQGEEQQGGAQRGRSCSRRRHDGAMRIACRVLFWVALVLGAPLAGAEAPFAFATTPGSLPKDVVPVEYALLIVPDIAARSFRGTGSYRIEVLGETRQIVLHALNLELVSASLRGPGQPRTALAPPVADAARQVLIFTLPQSLRRGRYTLDLAWTGRINATPEGLYADPYRGPAGDRVMLATFMEPGNARQLLPCWDEPAFRARFRLSLELPAGFAGYSNMPVVARRSLAAGGQHLQFATTPKMASYLLAFAAGELERISDRVAGTEVAVVATAGKLDRAQYALAASRQLLPYFNDYFGIRYPLPKLDHIAQPGGFGGAMENWGAIIYTETTLLVDPLRTPLREQKGAYGVIAHETAHQWFGNLVTMAWWDNLWLNEAFAEWMAIKAVDRFHPEWRLWLFASLGRDQAMNLDARATTHPIQQPVRTVHEADNAFDEITYQKGASFLRMLESWLGEAPFRRGIGAYMARHRYANTTGADLWAALAAASGKPVAAVALDWTTRPGFPLISVDARCDNGRRRVALEQERFQFGDGGASSPDIWRVPLQLGSVPAVPVASLLLLERSATTELAGCEGTLLVDPGNVGFFRVRYAPALFDALLSRWPSLPDAARLKLLADTSALVRSDQVSLASWMALLPRLRDEPRLAVWTKLDDELRAFDRLFVDEASRPALHRFAVRLFQPRFAALGWDEKPGESAEDRELRGLLAGALARFDDAAAIAESRARFWRFVADRSSLPVSLTDAVLRNAGRHADAAIWAQLKALAESALASEEKFRYYGALAQARDPALAARSLALALAPDVPQLARRDILRDVAAAGHVRMAWAFAQEHADQLLADTTRYAGGRMLARVVDTSAWATTADELEAFVAARLPADALVDARRAGDEIRTRARLKARLLPQLEAALAPP